MAQSKQSKVKVQFGETTKPFKAYTVNPGTTIVDFLKERGIEYGSGVRVNLKTVKKNYTFREGDLVTVTQAVSGGC